MKKRSILKYSSPGKAARWIKGSQSAGKVGGDGADVFVLWLVKERAGDS